ncbi:MAG: superoxide dismutase, Ni [Chloroflexota bacterium]|jgi:nickel superoxide dismutase|nr:superoxide dismutase, Ni [Chloroflexota bacterium]
MLTLRSIVHPTRLVHAHCDVPCGVYDPEQARIEAESCYRIIEKYHASDDEIFRQRCVIVKEARAEETKHHIDVLWHDYFKPEHLEKYPDLHDVCWKASKAASKVKAGTDLDAARDLLALIDQVDAMWKGTGGLEKTRLNGRPS